MLIIPARFRPWTLSSRIGTAAVLLLPILAIEPSSAFAQFERYELGRRLRVIEVEWDRVTDAHAKARATESLKSAVNAFFSFRMGDAGQSISQARFALKDKTGPSPEERWADSLCLKPEARLIDSTHPSLPVVLAVFFPTKAKKPENSRIRLVLGGSADVGIEAPITTLPMTVSLPLKSLAAGDHVLTAEIISGNAILANLSQTISLVDGLADRLNALRKTVGGWPSDTAKTTLDRESARSQLRMLESLAAKQTLESDFPANRILLNLEAQTLAAERSEPYLGKDRAGQAWVTVVTRTGRRVATRVFVPEAAAKGGPTPIVIALHGAGGSENMFFESYGHGAIVDRCRERGWLLVATRSNAFAGPPITQVVDELAKVYPVDKKRVMLVGHSMGAIHALASASNDPDRFAAVAALGGGGPIRPGAKLKSLPFFVGIGSEDFALSGSKKLVENLKIAEVATLTFREYPDIEHLSIVQVALSDVFEFFDKWGKAR